jgi:hypothetical protein
MAGETTARPEAGQPTPPWGGFELAGVGPGLGRAGLLALLAGERVAAGVDDDPPAVAALLDHPAEASCGQASATRMIIEASKASS